jgi:hypothetical protein
MNVCVCVCLGSRDQNQGELVIGKCDEWEDDGWKGYLIGNLKSKLHYAFICIYVQ